MCIGGNKISAGPKPQNHTKWKQDQKVLQMTCSAYKETGLQDP